jgi:hypothetical protein
MIRTLKLTSERRELVNPGPPVHERAVKEDDGRAGASRVVHDFAARDCEASSLDRWRGGLAATEPTLPTHRASRILVWSR